MRRELLKLMSMMDCKDKCQYFHCNIFPTELKLFKILFNLFTVYILLQEIADIWEILISWIDYFFYEMEFIFEEMASSQYGWTLANECTIWIGWKKCYFKSTTKKLLNPIAAAGNLILMMTLTPLENAQPK